MNESLGQVYGRYGSPITIVFGPIVAPRTYLRALHLLLMFPMGIAYLVGLVVVSSVAITFVGAPIMVAVFHVTFEFGGVIPAVDTVREGLVLVPIGLFALLAGVHLVNLVSAWHAVWARLMLASRVKNIPTIPEDIGPAPSDLNGGVVDLEGQPAAVVPGGNQAFEPTGLSLLTRREQEVLRLIAQGYSNAEIAEAFVISEGTVKTHIKRVLSKLDLGDRTQAAAYAYQVGFVKAGVLVRGSPGPIQMADFSRR